MRLKSLDELPLIIFRGPRMSALKDGQFDATYIAKTLLDRRKEYGNFWSLSHEQVLAVQKQITALNENYVGYFEETSIEVFQMCDPYPTHDENGKKRRRSRRLCHCRCYVLHFGLDPQIEADAILNAIKAFGRNEGIEEIKIGDLSIDPNDEP